MKRLLMGIALVLALLIPLRIATPALACTPGPGGCFTTYQHTAQYVETSNGGVIASDAMTVRWSVNVNTGAESFLSCSASFSSGGHPDLSRDGSNGCAAPSGSNPITEISWYVNSQGGEGYVKTLMYNTGSTIDSGCC